MSNSAVSANRLELLQIAEAVAREKLIDPDLVIEAMEDSLGKAARSRYGAELDIRAHIDRKSGEMTMFRAREVVEEHPELLSAEADAVLAQWIAEAEAQSNAEAVQHFQIFRERLARAREQGLDAIAPPMSAEKLSMMEELAALPEEVRNLFLTLVQNASNAEELHAALQEYPELLPVLSQVMGWR